jgi:hypothetical protein
MNNGPGEIRAFLRRTLGKGRGGRRVEGLVLVQLQFLVLPLKSEPEDGFNFLNPGSNKSAMRR